MRDIPLSPAPDLSPSEKLVVALDLAEVGYEMMHENLRRRHPDASDDEIQRLLTEWLHDRPGAEHGDGVGRPAMHRFADA